MCKCVSVFFGGWWMNSFASSISLLYFLGYGLSIFLLLSCFLFFFDMPCEHVAYLLWVCIFYLFFLSFFSQPTSLMVTLERKSHGMSWSFILWVDDNVLLSSSVEEQHMSGLVRDLDHENLTRLYQGSKNLTKLKAKSNCI